MDFNAYKAKYAATTTSATTAVNTTATKIDAAVKKGAVKTKDAAVTTGSALMGTLPVTTRKHNAFAKQVNAELNGINRRLERHDLLFDVVAEGVGLVLPSNETMDAYLDDQAAQAAQAAQAQEAAPAQEDLVASVVSKVLSSLGLAAATTPLSAEGLAYVQEAAGNAPTIAEQDAAEAGRDVAAANAEAKKEERRKAALAKKVAEAAKALEVEEAPEEEAEETVEKERPAKTIKRKRKKGGMGRQEPLAAE